MNGTGTRTRNVIGSIPAAPTPRKNAIPTSTTAIMLQTIPNTGWRITLGNIVRGQRSKSTIKNIAATIVTQKTSAFQALNKPCGSSAAT